VESTGGLNIAGVHSQHQARRPVQEAFADSILDGGYDFKVLNPGDLQILFLGGHDRCFFNKAGNPLDGFVAERALSRCELECVRNLVLEVTG
jgi:hypothetical protein